MELLAGHDLPGFVGGHGDASHHHLIVLSAVGIAQGLGHRLKERRAGHQRKPRALNHPGSHSADDSAFLLKAFHDLLCGILVKGQAYQARTLVFLIIVGACNHISLTDGSGKLLRLIGLRFLLSLFFRGFSCRGLGLRLSFRFGLRLRFRLRLRLGLLGFLASSLLGGRLRLAVLRGFLPVRSPCRSLPFRTLGGILFVLFLRGILRSILRRHRVPCLAVLRRGYRRHGLFLRGCVGIRGLNRVGIRGDGKVLIVTHHLEL